MYSQQTGARMVAAPQSAAENTTTLGHVTSLVINFAARIIIDSAIRVHVFTRDQVEARNYNFVSCAHKVILFNFVVTFFFQTGIQPTAFRMRAQPVKPH